MPKTRTGPLTVALFAGGAVIGLAVAGLWGYRALVEAPGPGTVQVDRRAQSAAERSRAGPPEIVWDRT
jgi:hypothetical protein